MGIRKGLRVHICAGGMMKKMGMEYIARGGGGGGWEGEGVTAARSSCICFFCCW